MNDEGKIVYERDKQLLSCIPMCFGVHVTVIIDTIGKGPLWKRCILFLSQNHKRIKKSV